MTKPTYYDAVMSLVGGSIGGPTNGPISELAFDGDELRRGVKTGHKLPSHNEVQEKLAELQAAYDAQAYSRSRESEYPSLQDCIHAILDNDLDALQLKRQAVKAKYPKP